MKAEHGGLLLNFPSHTRAERWADACVHAVGVPAGLVAAILLLVRAAPVGSALVLASLGIYAFGLVGMLSASAAYQLARPSARKEWLRRADRSMIYVMIAGTYTPISINVLYGHGGLWLCGLLWLLAGIGIMLTWRFPRRFERTGFVLYMIMGWMLVLLLKNCMAVLPGDILALIISGGLAYTIGAAIFKAMPKFYNSIWHMLVLCGAALQYAAISLQLTGHIG
jgi:hemolysin III